MCTGSKAGKIWVTIWVTIWVDVPGGQLWQVDINKHNRQTDRDLILEILFTQTRK